MSTSYQDIDTRLKVVEDKLQLVMEVASVTKKSPSLVSPGDFVMETMTLNGLYKQLRASGTEIERLTDDGT